MVFEKFDWDPAKSDKAVKQGRRPFNEVTPIFGNCSTRCERGLAA